HGVRYRSGMLVGMCLVLIGRRAHPEYRLIVAANREEFYTRPTESMRWASSPRTFVPAWSGRRSV
uniref:NRDE family protein n=1 Tax=Nocardia asiatica TaxID=209252 RepID=UPI002456E865